MNEDKKKLNEEEEAKVSGGAVAKPASNIVNGIDQAACIGCMYTVPPLRKELSDRGDPY